MNITITILSCIVIYLVITKFMQRSEIKRLRYTLENKRRKVNELIVDSKNKIVVFHLEYEYITREALEKLNRDFQELKERGYYGIVIDKSFDVKQKCFSSETATKLKSELNKEDE